MANIDIKVLGMTNQHETYGVRTSIPPIFFW